MAPKLKDFRRLLQLHATLSSPTANANEAATARKKTAEWLAKFGFAAKDYIAVLASAREAVRKNEEAKAAAAAPPPPPPGTYDAPPLDEGDKFNLLDLLTAVIDQYVSVTPEQCLFIALWILHTYIFERRLFMHTPRLLVTSPVRGCGKTTLMLLLEALVANGDCSDNVTAASLYYAMDPYGPTPSFLLDESDNLDLLHNPILRAVLNAGYLMGRKIKRYVGGAPRRFEVFAPLGLAGIDALNRLPLPLLRRCITVEMQRRAREAKPLPKLNTQDLGFQQERDMLRDRFNRWAANFPLNPPDPAIPPELSDSAADNWRVLFAVADDLGRGAEARAAALKLSDHQKEDDTILLLCDIRRVFDTFHVDRFWIETLVEALLNMPDSQWLDWRGPDGDEQPHKLTTRELRRVLRSFGILAHTLWMRGSRKQRGASSNGYYRSDFEPTWARYCPSSAADTQTHRHTPQLPKPPAARRKRKATVTRRRRSK
jgi:putative DNA primase/helicase